MNCKYKRLRSKKSSKYWYCKLHKKVIENCVGCNDMVYKDYKMLSNRSKMLSKREKERFSIIALDSSVCSMCGKYMPKLDIHEIFSGSNRTNSMKYGLCLYLCRECHSRYQNDKEFNDYWHKIGQTAFENKYKDLDFVSIFHKNYK